MAARASAPPVPPAKQPRNPISRKQVETVISRSVAIFGIVFGAQTLPFLIAQIAEPHAWWLWIVVPAMFGSLLFATFMSWVGRWVRQSHALVAIVYVAALATWPLTVMPGVQVADSPHWLYYLLTVATACAAIAFNTLLGSLYLVLVPAIYFVGRVTVNGGSPSWQLAALETVYSIILGSAVMVIVTMLRQASSSVDAAQATALDRYSHAVRQHALEVERVQVDSIVHDSVLTTLLSAARAYTPEAKDLASRMAGAAIGHLRDAALVSPDDSSTVSLRALAKQLGDETREMPQFELRAHALGDGSVPAQAAEVIHSATVQAMLNSLQHGGDDGAVRRWVELSPNPGGLRVVVGDDGVGFDPILVPNERLGVRLSIIERVANAGGVATVQSSPGTGTIVTVSWPDDTPPAPLAAYSSELGLTEPESAS
jgi:signal transduction histidine kinase